jgi:hypothetical protein
MKGLIYNNPLINLLIDENFFRFLFKFKFLGLDSESINNFLKRFNFFEFGYRIVYKLFNFTYFIINLLYAGT